MACIDLLYIYSWIGNKIKISYINLNEYINSNDFKAFYELSCGILNIKCIKNSEIKQPLTIRRLKNVTSYVYCLLI